MANLAAACSGLADEVALFERALYPDLRSRAPKPSAELHIKWKLRPPDGLFQGRCCIDGAGLDPQDLVLCRAGWAICQIDRVGNVVGEACGNVPGPLQHSGLGELYACLMLLETCMPPLVVVTDYKDLIDGVAEGRKACTAAHKKGADVWRRGQAGRRWPS